MHTTHFTQNRPQPGSGFQDIWDVRRILFLLVFVPTVILRMGWLISRFLISWALRGTVFVFFYLLMAVAAAITLCMVVSYVLLTACGSHLRFPY